MKESMKKQKQITLKDFASETGISISAISRILNGKETYCSPQKRQEVLALAEKWNYKSNIGYRIMTGMSTNITAIIFSQERVTYSESNLRLLVELIKGLEGKGYAVYSTVMTEDGKLNYEKFLELDRKGCRSYIFIGNTVGKVEMLEYILKNSYNYIGMNFSYNIKQKPRLKEIAKSINLDQANAIQEYLKIFRKKKIENFRLLMPKRYFEHNVECSIKNSERMPFRKKFVDTPSCEFTSSDGFDIRYENAYSAMRQEYRNDPDIRGVICITDFHALGAARFFHDIGRKVGDDVLICGMFDTVAARFSPLPIITSKFDMQKTASLMLDHLFTPEPVQIMIRPEIMMQSGSFLKE